MKKVMCDCIRLVEIQEEKKDSHSRSEERDCGDPGQEPREGMPASRARWYGVSAQGYSKRTRIQGD